MVTIQIRAYSLGLIISLISISPVFAQQAEAPADTAFKKVMEQAFQKLEESNNSEDVQRKYADIFWDYYLEHPDRKYSEWAGVHAFKFWGNWGAVDKVKKAMAQLDSDAEFWSYFIAFVPSVYINNEDKTKENAVQLLEGLTNTLTHPKSKSRVYWWLASYYDEQNDTEKLKGAARAMIKLDAIEGHVNEGLKYLREIASLNVGQGAPSFQATTVDGKALDVPINDKIIILEFWATWCGACIREIPHLKTTDKSYSDDQVKIVGVALEKDLQKVKEFISKKKMGWAQIIEPDEWGSSIAQKYSVVGVPRSYIIGPDGKILAKDLRGEGLEQKIAELVSEQ